MQNTSGSVHQRDLEYSTMVGNHQQFQGMIFTSVVSRSESGSVSIKTPLHLTATKVFHHRIAVDRITRISSYVVHVSILEVYLSFIRVNLAATRFNIPASEAHCSFFITYFLYNYVFVSKDWMIRLLPNVQQHPGNLNDGALNPHSDIENVSKCGQSKQYLTTHTIDHGNATAH